jgi:hypothetical protein
MRTIPATSEQNGDEAPQPKPKRKRKASKHTAADPFSFVRPVDPAPSLGRLAADISLRKIDWLLSPWLPRGMLSLVVGLPSIGKSTFMAFLMRHASACVIMPGYEEDPEVTTLPRMKANGVNLKTVRFLDDWRYTLPRDQARIARIVTHAKADLLVIDPIDSYLDDELNENNGRDVRALLESAATIATKTGAAVVGVRHPGKDRSNVLPGSRQWRAVPRCILELTLDGSRKARNILRHYKDSLGQDARPRQYTLEGERGKPKRFLLAGEIDVSLAGLAGIAKDPTERHDIRAAGKAIRELFRASGEPFIPDLVALCRQNGVSDTARRQAMELLGIEGRPGTLGGKWIMTGAPSTWPPWTDEDGH